MKGRVLIIDDDQFIRSLVTAMLRSEYLASVAVDGMEGFKVAVENPPDLIIVDLEMPGWNGLETMKNLRSHATLQRTPVMVLTADASRETVMEAIKMGADDYLIKTSLSRDELLRKVRRLSSIEAGRDVAPLS